MVPICVRPPLRCGMLNVIRKRESGLWSHSGLRMVMVKGVLLLIRSATMCLSKDAVLRLSDDDGEAVKTV